MSKQTPESALLHAVCEYFELQDYVFWRQNNTPVYDVARGIHRAMPKYSKKGVSDLILIHKGVTFFIELKAKKGVQSQDQKDFEKLVSGAGAKYILFRDLDEVIEYGF